MDWNNLDKESYQNELTTQLEKCELNISNTDHIDETIVIINRAIKTAIETIAPPRKLKDRRPKLKVRYIQGDKSNNKNKLFAYGKSMGNHRTLKIHFC